MAAKRWRDSGSTPTVTIYKWSASSKLYVLIAKGEADKIKPDGWTDKIKSDGWTDEIKPDV
jgi:hypothetical protein